MNLCMCFRVHHMCLVCFGGPSMYMGMCMRVCFGRPLYESLYVSVSGCLKCIRICGWKYVFGMSAYIWVCTYFMMCILGCLCIYLCVHGYVCFGISLHVSGCMHFFGLWHVSRCVFLECLGVSGCVHVYMFISEYFCMYLGMHMYMCWYVSSCIQVCGTPQGLCACAIPAHTWGREGGAALGCLVSCK